MADQTLDIEGFGDIRAGFSDLNETFEEESSKDGGQTLLDGSVVFNPPSIPTNDPITSETVTPVDELPFVEETVPVVTETVSEEPQTFTTPNGAIVDIDGNIITDAPAPEPDPATPQADEATRLFESIAGEGGFNEQLEGRADFEAAERKRQGITDLTTTQNDLRAQLKSLNLQSKDLVNQFNLVNAQVQEESIGRGRTAAGVAPIVAGRQRSLALAQSAIASQSLITQAQLSAVEGSLANARLLVKEAVDVKYGAILQEKADAIANLELLNLSGILTREETKRAEEQLKRDNLEVAQINEQKQNDLDIFNMVAEAAPVLGKLPNGASILQRMQNAPTPQAAFQIAFENGVYDQAGGGYAFSLSAGQTAFDSAGNPIASVAPKDDGSGGPSDFSISRAERNINAVDNLMAQALVSPEIFGRSAAVPAPDFLRSDAFRNYKQELKTLQANIAFGEITQMREASKTGGALGQVSERELALLEAALGALNMTQSPENIRTELQKVKDSIQRWQTAWDIAVKDGQVQKGVPVPNPENPNETIIITD